MCGRYTVISDDDVAELRTIIPGFRGHIPAGGGLMSADNGEKRIVFPGMSAPVLTQHGDLLAARWGFRKWDGKGLVFNARVEGLRSSRFFSEHLEFGRCIAPARDYFEWRQTTSDSGRAEKRRCRIYPERGLFYLCALMRPADEGFEYTVVTRPAEPEIAFIHPRMPLLLDPDAARGWLSGAETRLGNFSLKWTDDQASSQ